MCFDNARTPILYIKCDAAAQYHDYTSHVP